MPLRAVGSAEIDVNLHELTAPFTAAVMNNLSPDNLIIGYCNSIVSFAYNILQLPIMSTDQKQYFVRLIKTTIVPPFCEADIKVSVPSKFAKTDILIEPWSTNGSEDYAVARILQYPNEATTTCRILNYENKQLVLPRRLNIAVITLVDVEKDCTKLKDIKTKTVPLDENSHATFEKLTPKQQQKFLSEYGFKLIFARLIMDLKVFKGYEAELNILDKRPFMQRQYKLPKEHLHYTVRYCDVQLLVSFLC